MFACFLDQLKWNIDQRSNGPNIYLRIIATVLMLDLSQNALFHFNACSLLKAVFSNQSPRNSPFLFLFSVNRNIVFVFYLFCFLLIYREHFNPFVVFSLVRVSVLFSDGNMTDVHR